MYPGRAGARLLVAVSLLVVTTPVLAGEGPGRQPSPVAGQEARETLTLEGAIRIALERNHLLGASRARVDAAEAGVQEARSGRLPRLDLEETFTRTTNPVFVFGNLLGQEAFGPENFAVDRLNEPDPLSNWHTRVSLSLPVWAGGRIGNGIDAARAQRVAAASESERTRQEVIHGVVEAYTGAVVAGRHLEVAEDALETARAHVDLVADLREGGLVVESDLLQARVRMSEVQEAVIRAESAVEISRAALNLAMGRDLATPISLPREPEGTEAPGDGQAELAVVTEALPSLIDEALQARPDLAAAEQKLRAASLGAEIARGGRLPEVGVGGSFEANSEPFLGADGTNWTLMLSVRFTPFDGFATDARIGAAEARVSEARQMRDLLRQSIELEVRRAAADVRAARQRVSTALEAVEMAEAGLTIVEDRYREGLTTVVELLEAETALTRARTRVVAARRDSRLARASLDLAVGRS